VEFGIFALYRPLQQLNYKYILFYKILSLDVSLGPKRALFMKGMQFLTKNAHLLNFCTIGHIGVISPKALFTTSVLFITATKFFINVWADYGSLQKGSQEVSNL
jgi:hypothetical protein